MSRQPEHWITNVHQGGDTERARRRARRWRSWPRGALAAVGADYAGVDLIRTPDGRLLVLEVN